MLKRLKWVRSSWMLALAPVLAAWPAGAQNAPSGTAPLDERESYAFVRTVQGEATVAPEGNGFGDAVERNQPLLTGDRVRTEGASRLEIILPDHNRLSVDRDSTVGLARLAFSGDRESRITVLELAEGEILLEVTEEALGDELPRIEAADSTLYIQEPGTYRVRLDREGWLEVTARDGYAELVTDRGSTVVRNGEAAVLDSNRGGRVQISSAEGLDALERWSRDLDQAAAGTGRSARYIDSRVSYAAGDLDQNGDWVVYQNVNYWRPHVEVGWSPYWSGRWGWTPSGYTWVSYEPWGWVPYHYGTWCQVHGFGWVWRPGSVYSPAWVYWNWSNGYVGWCPTGYYTGYYDPWYNGGFRWGYYGWAGGAWGNYSYWNFAPTHCFRDNHYRGNFRHGDELGREKGGPEAPRGLITTDTRDFRPDRIDQTDQLLHRIGAEEKARRNHDLPDVTDFVGRKHELPPTIARAIAPDTPKEPRIRFDQPRVAETPGWRDGGKGGGGKGGEAQEIAKGPRLDTGQRGDVQGRGSVGTKGEVATRGGDTKAVDDWRGSTGNTGRGGEGTGKGTVTARGGENKPADSWRGSSPGTTARGGEGTGKGAGTEASMPPRKPVENPTISVDNRQGWKGNTPEGTKNGMNDRSSTVVQSGRREMPDLSSGGSTYRSNGNGSSGTKSYPADESKTHSSAPVERVIGGTRRTVPQGDNQGWKNQSTYPSGGVSEPRYGSSSSTRSYPSQSDPGNSYRTPSSSTPTYTRPSGDQDSKPVSSGSTRSYPSQYDPGKSYRSSSPSYTPPSGSRTSSGSSSPSGSYSAPRQGSSPSYGSSSSSGSGSSGGSKGSSTSSGHSSGSGGRSSSSGSSKSGSSNGSSSSSTSSSKSSGNGGGGDKDH